MSWKFLEKMSWRFLEKKCPLEVFRKTVRYRFLEEMSAEVFF